MKFIIEKGFVPLYSVLIILDEIKRKADYKKGIVCVGFLSFLYECSPWGMVYPEISSPVQWFL